jgi:hypothetical protein
MQGILDSAFTGMTDCDTPRSHPHQREGVDAEPLANDLHSPKNTFYREESESAEKRSSVGADP